jgi:hypothetical protein
MSANTASAILKNELHRLVVQTDDMTVLRRVKKIFDLMLEEGANEEDWWDELTEQEKAMIQRGLQQLDNGERIPNGEARLEISNLLQDA